MIDPYFNTSQYIVEKQYENSLGLGQYFVRMPWVWARFQSQSRLVSGQEGFQLKLEHNATQISTTTGHNKDKKTTTTRKRHLPKHHQ
jgi:hypothetical protein